MARIEKIPVAELFAREEFKRLSDAYAAEAGNPEFGKWEIDQDAYVEAEKSGYGGWAFAVYEDEKDKLVGFAYAICATQPHFCHTRVLAVDAIYVDPAARRKGAGLSLIKALRGWAKVVGAAGVLLGAKNGTAAYRFYDGVAKPMNTLFWMQA